MPTSRDSTSPSRSCPSARRSRTLRSRSTSRRRARTTSTGSDPTPGWRRCSSGTPWTGSCSGTGENGAQTCGAAAQGARRHPRLRRRRHVGQHRHREPPANRVLHGQPGAQRKVRPGLSEAAGHARLREEQSDHHQGELAAPAGCADPMRPTTSTAIPADPSPARQVPIPSRRAATPGTTVSPTRGRTNGNRCSKATRLPAGHQRGRGLRHRGGFAAASGAASPPAPA